VDGEVVVDREGRLPGRGAYLCPEPGCAAKLVRRGGLARRLRVPATATAALEQRLRVEQWPPVWKN